MVKTSDLTVVIRPRLDMAPLAAEFRRVAQEFLAFAERLETDPTFAADRPLDLSETGGAS